MTEPEPPGLAALADLRVVELGVWVAAPAASALLADWGADVIKVEPPTGDPMRHAFGSLGIGTDLPNPAFAQDNRGKRSVVLDLRDAAERARFEDLLASADVFLSNLRPDALDALDLEPSSTVARHPRLVYCSVSGYGLRGPDRNRPAYDIGAFWARSGLSVQLANGEGVPLNARGGIGDHISGLAALAGLLAAVLEQRQTGRGRVVEVSLLRTGTYVLGWDLSLQATVGKVARAEARDSNQTPLMNSYRTADALWFFFTGLEADRHIANVCRALGRTDLLADPALPMRPPSAATATTSSPCSTRSSRGRPSTSGPIASTAKACGGHRRRARLTSWRIRSWRRTTASSRRGTPPPVRAGARSTDPSASRISRCARRRPRPHSGSTTTRCSPNWPRRRPAGPVSPEPGPGPAAPGR